MATYSAIEEAVRQALIAVDYFELTEETCGNSMSDVLQTQIERNVKYSCLLAFGGTGRRPQEPQSGLSPMGVSMGQGRVWSVRIFGVIWQRYFGSDQDAETDIRLAVDNLKTLLQADRRLGGIVPFADIISIEPPEPITLNEIPFFAIAFTIEAWDKT